MVQQIYWHVRITIESSTKQTVEELARAERRSVANYLRVLIDKDIRERVPS